MKTLKEFLIKHKACSDGFEFAKDLTLEQFLNTCERGAWILWLFKRTNPKDKRARVLANAHCANTVRHLMKDQRSLNAVDIAIKFGNNDATEQELFDAAVAAAAAYAAADDADAEAAAAAYDAADAAYDAPDAFAADAAAYAAACAYTVDAAAADAAYVAAQKANQKMTADICRKYLPIEIWNNKEI